MTTQASELPLIDEEPILGGIVQTVDADGITCRTRDGVVRIAAPGK